MGDPSSRRAGDVDFADHEWRGVFEPLADPLRFAQVEVDPVEDPEATQLMPETFVVINGEVGDIHGASFGRGDEDE
jgi:hypothetical protein